MKTAVLLRSSVPFVPQRRDTALRPARSARDRLKDWLRAGEDTWAAIALAEAGVVDGAEAILQTLPTRPAA